MSTQDSNRPAKACALQIEDIAGGAGTWTKDAISPDVERVLNSSLFYVLAVDRSICPSSDSSPVGVLCRASMTGDGQFANPDFSFFRTVD